MPATRESQARTDAFARVIGTWLVIVPGIIVLRASGMSAFASEFFENGLFVWFAGALLLFGGLLIIAFHQFWSSVAAVIISLFGWILALRGLVLMAAPQIVRTGHYVYGRDTSRAARVRCSRRDCFISPMWVGSPSLPHHWQRTTREANDA
jgi:hypothetical protein